jgi:hypothetical protein
MVLNQRFIFKLLLFGKLTDPATKTGGICSMVLKAEEN